MNYRTTKAVILSFGLLMVVIEALGASELDHAVFGKLLSAHVSDGRVDYKGFKDDEVQLDQYLNAMALVDPETLTRADKMAFYINLYNAWTIKLILSRYPDIHSIKEIGTIFRSPWKKEIVRLNGRTVTLDYIEHKILRPDFKDPRIHFAVNCASVSCPPLRNEPYTGSHIEDQLNRATTDFINNPERNYLENGTLHVSRIFKWYADDFKGGVVPFIKSFARDGLKKKIAADESNLKVEYLDYDWSLNGS